MEWKKKSKLKVLKCSQSRHGFDVSLDSQVKELLSTWQEISVLIGLDMLLIESLDLNMVLTLHLTFKLKSCSLCVELY